MNKSKTTNKPSIYLQFDNERVIIEKNERIYRSTTSVRKEDQYSEEYWSAYVTIVVGGEKLCEWFYGMPYVNDYHSTNQNSNTASNKNKEERDKIEQQVEDRFKEVLNIIEAYYSK